MLADDFYLYDTPVLWPRASRCRGVQLVTPARSGATPATVVALELAGLPETAARRRVRALGYRGGTAEVVAAMKDEELLEAIGRQRSALLGKDESSLRRRRKS